MSQAQTLIAKVGSKYVNDLGKHCTHTGLSVATAAVKAGARREVSDQPVVITYRFADGSTLWRFAADGELRVL